MNKVFVWFFAGLVVIAAAAFVNPVKPLAELFKNGAIPNVTTTNAAVDECVRYAKSLLNNTTAPLPDIFDKIVDKHGRLIKVELTKGQISGIETVYRDGDSKSTIQKNFGRLVINAGFSNITITYNYKVKRAGQKREGKVTAGGSGFRAFVAFLTDRQTLKVSSYNIHTKNIGPTDFKLKGKKKADKRTKKIFKAIIPVLKNLIESAINKTVVKVGTDILNLYNSSF